MVRECLAASLGNPRKWEVLGTLGGYPDVSCCIPKYLDVEPKIGVVFTPQIIPGLIGCFPYFHHPFWRFSHYFWVDTHGVGTIGSGYEFSLQNGRTYATYKLCFDRDFCSVLIVLEGL